MNETKSYRRTSGYDSPGEPKRDFKGVMIPKEVWFDDRLSALDKIILTEIDSLDGDDGCYAKNDYLAKFCHCSESKVSKAISKLIDLGYVYRASFDGRQRILRSTLSHPTEEHQPKVCLVKNARQTSKKCQADSQNLPDIYIDRSSLVEKNNQSIARDGQLTIFGEEEPVERKPKRRRSKKDEAIEAQIDEILEYYFEVTGRVGVITNKTSRGHVRGRLKDGFTVEQAKSAIRKKTADVKGGDYEYMLDIDKLFKPTNFENALNMPEPRRQQAKDGGARNAEYVRYTN